MCVGTEPGAVATGWIRRNRHPQRPGRYRSRFRTGRSPKNLVDTLRIRPYAPKSLGGNMAKQKSEHLTPLELEIMHVLWETGPANVQTVQQRLKRDLAYTTVQTMLNILHRKKKVKRALKDRAYFYKPAVSHSQVVSHTIGDVIDRLFGG